MLIGEQLTFLSLALHFFFVHPSPSPPNVPFLPSLRMQSSAGGTERSSAPFMIRQNEKIKQPEEEGLKGGGGGPAGTRQFD